MKEKVIICLALLLIIGLSYCSAYAKDNASVVEEAFDQEKTYFNNMQRSASHSTLFDNVPCGQQNAPQGYEGGNADMFDRINLYGRYMPGRLNIGRAQCISNPQNQTVCDKNMYNQWYWFSTLKVGFPSRNIFAYESPNPILTVHPRNTIGVDESDPRRYYDN